MGLTLENILENENIKADRFAMAAISYIFKAFGDTIRSKEYWPWGDKVNFPWDNDNQPFTNDMIFDEKKYNWNTSGNKSDLTRAMLCLRQAQERSENEEYIKTKEKHTNDIKDLQKRLNKINLRNKSISKITDKINKTSSEIQEQNSIIS